MAIHWLLPLVFLPWSHAASGLVQPAQKETAHRYLARTFDLTGADLRALDEGRVFSTTLPTSDSREVGTLGIVRMAITPEFYADRLADIASFKKTEAVVQIGTFSAPAQPGDVRGLTLDEDDLRSLRSCRIGDCDVQLPAELIERFRTEIEWKSADASDKANALMRQALVDLVNRYRTVGNNALFVYADGKNRLDTAAAFRDLVDGDRRVLTEFPELRQYVLTPTATLPSRSSDVIYWSKEKAGGKTVVTVTHLTITRTSTGGPAVYVAASRQLYANHYFDASLGLTLLVNDDASAASTYVVYMNRSRVDTFTGLFGGVARRIVRSRARSTVSELLPRLRTRLERAYAADRAEPER